MGNYLEVIKKIFNNKSDPKKRTQNLILIVVLLVIVLIAINYIYKEDKNSLTDKKTGTISNKTINISDKKDSDEYNEVDEKLKRILGQIHGISDVDVMLTYAKDTKMTPVYDVREDKSEENTGANSSNKTNKKTTVEKKVAYEEKDGEKIAIIESVESPVVLGVIVVAKGAGSQALNTKIKEAVSASLDVALHKVQVFERKD